jgi:hypothetical protein
MLIYAAGLGNDAILSRPSSPVRPSGDLTKAESRDEIRVKVDKLPESFRPKFRPASTYVLADPVERREKGMEFSGLEDGAALAWANAKSRAPFHAVPP